MNLTTIGVFAFIMAAAMAFIALIKRDYSQNCVCDACNAVYFRPQGDLKDFYCTRCKRSELRDPKKTPFSRILLGAVLGSLFGGCLAGAPGAMTFGIIAIVFSDRP